MRKHERPSVYLEEKCANMQRTLGFFLDGSHNRCINEKLVTFLSQIDFWDWEIENMIFSFTNFEERSKAWESRQGFAEALRNEHGILLRRGIEGDWLWKRGWRSKATTEVYAPFGHLNEVIKRWNKLLRTCEERVLVNEDKLENYTKLGAQVAPNLDKYRKKELKS